MTKFTDNLWRDLADEHGADLTRAGRPQAGWARRPSSRVIAGGTLTAVALGAAVTLVLTSGGSMTTGSVRVVTDAYTITRSSGGSVLVQINQRQSIDAANQKLNAMLKEQVVVRTVSGPASVKGPVACSPGEPNMQGPPVKVLLGADGTQVIAPGTTAGNTGVGTWHLTACFVYPSGDMGTGGTGIAGNTGVG